MNREKTNDRTTAKRTLILEKALKVFAEEGFRNTDVQVIANLAKVGKGTVYRHFGNKQLLFLATSNYCFDSLLKFISSDMGYPENIEALAREKSTAEVLRRLAVSCARFYRSSPHSIEIMIQERAEFRRSIFHSSLLTCSGKKNEVLISLIQKAMVRGELKKMDVQIAYNAFCDVIVGSVIGNENANRKLNLVERVETAVNLFIQGFQTKN